MSTVSGPEGAATAKRNKQLNTNKMTQKILIYRDKSGIATFIKDVQQTCEDCNALINLFNSFQPWTSITELSQFEELAADPGKYFDDTIL